MPYKNKDAQKAAQHTHYLKHKQAYRARVKQRRARNKEYAYASKTPCTHCGIPDKACLDFHHLRDRVATIAQLIRDGCSLQTLQAELDKCECICCNCHQKLHNPQVITDGSAWAGFDQKRIEKRAWFITFIAAARCTDCPENDSRCLEWHHIKTKRFKISYLLTSGHSLAFLQEELARCVVLCANCHRKRHAKGD